MAAAAVAAREEEEGGGGGGMQEGGRRSRYLWTFDSRLYLDISRSFNCPQIFTYGQSDL